MNSNWTYKKLGEVARIVGGSTPLTTNPSNWTGKNAWITPAELKERYISCTERSISDEAARRLELLPVGTVLLSSRAPIGKVALTTIPMYCNQGFKNIICGESLYNEYTYWCILANVPRLQGLGVGATFKEISKRIVENFEIPVPALSKQHSIAEELDTIQSILDKQNTQLLELDKLAQAIFCEMFGDLLSNEKGWNISTLGTLFDIGSSKRVYQSEWTTSGVPFYRAREIVKLAKDGHVDNELFIAETLYDQYAAKYGVPNEGDILVTAVGTLGVTYIVKHNDRFYYKDGNIICLHQNGSQVNSLYVDFCFKTPFIRQQIDNWNGATVGTFTIVKAKATRIPLPPLSLQQSFAEKIEAIEQQKQLLRQSIRETEKLLAARMQYYFD